MREWLITVAFIGLFVAMTGLIAINVVTGCSRDNPRACVVLGW